MKKILVTGAGGPAAIAFLRAVRSPLLELHAADMDPNAAGLFLVAPEQRHVIPGGTDPEFATQMLALCHSLEIDVLVPTVDVEMVPLALWREAFEAVGVRLLMSSTQSLELCLDKAALIAVCRDKVPCPETELLEGGARLESLSLPLIAKPRQGSGSRGVRVVQTEADLGELPADGSYLLQEYLPGEEYSVDVLATMSGEVLAAVPRSRMKVDSGIAVTARTLQDPELELLSARAVRCVGLSLVSNVQWKRDAKGTPRLLEINPRFPGTMPLTVASGIDMPNLSLRLLDEEAIPAAELRFCPLAMVRTWQEHFLSESELFVPPSVSTVETTQEVRS